MVDGGVIRCVPAAGAFDNAHPTKMAIPDNALCENATCPIARKVPTPNRVTWLRQAYTIQMREHTFWT